LLRVSESVFLDPGGTEPKFKLVGFEASCPLVTAVPESVTFDP